MALRQYSNDPSMALIEEMSIPEPNSGCWLWLGNLNSNGYPRISLNYKKILCHRLSWSEFNKCEIPKGMMICHKCDNPACVNPEHLFLGSPRDNAHDRDRKGRTSKGRKHSEIVKIGYKSGRVPWAKMYPEKTRKGNNHPNSKLTEDIVCEIRTSTETDMALAARFGVSNVAVRFARIGRTWKCVSTPPVQKNILASFKYRDQVR